MSDSENSLHNTAKTQSPLQEILPSPAWRRVLRSMTLEPLEIVITNFLYRLSHSSKPWIRKPLTRFMLRRFKIDMSEALQPDPEQYARFSDLFIRRLRAGVRPVDAREDIVVSSVDGCISQVGLIEADGTIVEVNEKKSNTKKIFIKGIRYSLLDLLGGMETMAARYLGGAYNNTYLAPHNYHRMHMPFEGSLQRILRIPGRLRSVSQVVQLDSPEPVMTTNERVVLEFKDPEGKNFALVFVGAVGVSGIACPWMDFRHRRHYGSRRQAKKQGLELYEVEAGCLLCKTSSIKKIGKIIEEACVGEDAFFRRKGEEVGVFEMGSTVVVLFGPEFGVKWLPSVLRGAEVKMGEAVGTAS